MQENEKQVVNTHVRLHDRNGYVLSIDLDCDVQVAAKHILKLRDADTDESLYCEGCGEVLNDPEINSGFMCHKCIQGDMATLQDRVTELETALATERNQREANARVMQAFIREFRDDLTEGESLDLGDEMQDEEEIALYRLKNDGTI